VICDGNHDKGCFLLIINRRFSNHYAVRGAHVLELRSIVQFPVHKTNAYSLQDFVAALRTNDTISSIRCNRHFTTGFNDEEWREILIAFGQVRRLENLVFVDGGDSRLRRLRIDLLADILQSARRIRKLEFGKFWLLMGNDGHRQRFAATLRCHATLESFVYAGCGIHTQLYQTISPRAVPDALIEALSTCPNLKSVHITNSPYCAYDYSVAGLIHLMACADVTLPSPLQTLSIVTRPSNWRMVGSVLHRSALQRLVLIHSGRDACTADALMALLYNLRLSNRLQYLALHLCGLHSYFPQTGLDQTDQRRHSISQVMADTIRQNSTLLVWELSDGTGHGFETTGIQVDATADDHVVPFKRYRATKLYSDARNVREYSFDSTDYHILADAVRDNGNVQLYIDVALPEDNEALRTAQDRLHMESILNAVQFRQDHGNNTNVHRDGTERCYESLSKLMDHFEQDDGPMLQSCLYTLVRSSPLLCHRLQ
jgi:hypothetical protein